jgi:hypothetical protein
VTKNRAAAVKAAPKQGEKHDDFQLTYALRLLRGQEVIASGAPKTTPN